MRSVKLYRVYPPPVLEVSNLLEMHGTTVIRVVAFDGNAFQ